MRHRSESAQSSLYVVLVYRFAIVQISFVIYAWQIRELNVDNSRLKLIKGIQKRGILWKKIMLEFKISNKVVELKIGAGRLTYIRSIL